MRYLFILMIGFSLHASPVAEPVAPRYSILQGATSDSVTHFTVVVREGEDVQFRASAGQQTFTPEAVERVAYPGSIWNVYRLRFSGLSAEAKYNLEVVNADGAVTDRRGFHTLDPSARKGRVGILSCMVTQLHNPFMWNHLALPENRPDAMLFIGDSTYLDRDNLFSAALPTSGRQVWENLAKSRNTLNVYFWQDLVPIFSVWDDHDSGGNNVTAISFPLMPEVRKVYDTFFANEEIDGFLEHGPGLAKSFSLFGQKFIMLDNRSFREVDPIDPMFGAEQEKWAIDQLSRGDNFLVNGVQFFGGFIKKDSLEYDYPKELASFITRIRARGEAVHAKIAFVSGDTHFSETQIIESAQLGYPTYEITSSSVHSFAAPGHYLLKPANPRRLQATGTHNVVLFEFAPTQAFSFHIRSLGWRGNDLFSNDLTIDGSCEDRLLASPRLAKPRRAL